MQKSLYWHGKEPVVTFTLEPWPWDSMGWPLTSRIMLPLDPRSIVYTDPKAKYAWWDGSCLVTALVKEGPKEMVLWKP